MQLVKVPIPKVMDDYLESYKFLIIRYKGEYYIRWGSLKENENLEHPDIEKAFIRELQTEGLPTCLEEITADTAFIHQDKRIEFHGGGSLNYKNATFDLFKSIIQSDHPDYDVSQFES